MEFKQFIIIITVVAIVIYIIIIITVVFIFIHIIIIITVVVIYYIHFMER